MDEGMYVELKESDHMIQMKQIRRKVGQFDCVRQLKQRKEKDTTGLASCIHHDYHRLVVINAGK